MHWRATIAPSRDGSLRAPAVTTDMRSGYARGPVPALRGRAQRFCVREIYVNGALNDAIDRSFLTEGPYLGGLPLLCGPGCAASPASAQSWRLTHVLQGELALARLLQRAYTTRPDGGPKEIIAALHRETARIIAPPDTTERTRLLPA